MVGVMTEVADTDEWVLLAYRLPREPSTPRSTVWRKLKRLGVAQLSDGLVALPADAAGRAAIEQRMSAAVAAEYDAVTTEAAARRDGDPATRRRVVARLRRELHRIQARDIFGASQRDAAVRAVDEL